MSRVLDVLENCSNMLGKLGEEEKQRIIRHLRENTAESWNDCYSIIVGGINRVSTLWQGWIAIDPTAPRSVPFCEDPKGAWEVWPDPFTTVQAIEYIINQKSERD